MADKKTATKVTKAVKKAEVKHDAKKAVKATAELLKDLRTMTVADLNGALIDAKADLKKAQKMLKSNELPATHVIKNMKTKIARIHAVMTEKQNEKEAK